MLNHSIKFVALIIFCLIFNSTNLKSQKEIDSGTLPYHSIGEYPAEHNASNIMKRLVDGLGYRYYWATEDLKQSDLDYKPSEDGRSTYETLEHIYNLSRTIRLFSEDKAIERSSEDDSLSWDSLRKKTLNNIKTASEMFSSLSEEELFSLSVKFKRGERESSFDFWHIVNGQISDAIYHVGQIVSNRRSSGNPLDPSVNVFMGKSR